MAENSATEWILINLKFRGKCIGCGKVITSGRALWSRSTKSIKHLDCSLSNANQTSSDNEKTAFHKEEKSHSRVRKTIVQTCYICEKEEPEEDEYDINKYPYLKEINSRSYVCQSCLQREDAFEAYRQVFLQKNKRYIK